MKKLTVVVLTITLAFAGMALASFNNTKHSLSDSIKTEIGMKCGFCKGTGFQGNFNCFFCKGKGRNGSY